MGYLYYFLPAFINFQRIEIMKYQTLVQGMLVSAITIALAGNVAMARGKGGKGPRFQSDNNTTQEDSDSRQRGQNNFCRGEQDGPRQGKKHKHADRFSRIDADGDGLIYESEFVTAKTDRVSRHFQHIDSDEDLFISEEEYEAHAHKKLDRLGIDEAEMQSCMQEALGEDFEGKPGWSDLVAEADTDADNLISEAEMTAHAAMKTAEKFAALDVNADSSLDEDEFSALREERKAVHEAHRTCVDDLLEASAL